MPLEPWGQRYKKKPKVNHGERRKTEGMREGCTCGHGPMISNPTPRTVFFSRHKRKRGPLTEQNVYRIGNHIQKLTTVLLTKSARVSFYPDYDAIRHADKANLVFYDNKRYV